MSDLNHRDEIIQSVKLNIGSRQELPMQFSNEQLESTQNAIFDQVDADIKRTCHRIDSPRAAEEPDSANGWLGWIGKLASDATRLVSQAEKLPAAVALVVIAGISTALFIDLKSDVPPSDKLTAMTGLSPAQSLTGHADDLAHLIEHGPLGSRALVSTNRTDRYRAFEAGLLIADLQMLANHDLDISSNLVESYIERGLAFTDQTQGHGHFDIFYETIERLLQDRETTAWLKQGYIVESLYLTSIIALNDFDTTALQRLLTAYRQLAKQTFYGSQNRQYMDNHRILMNSSLDDSPTPDQIDTLTEAIRNLKTLAQ